MTRRDPRCEICGDAYGTGRVCAACREDPANRDWVASREPSVEVRDTDDVRAAYERPTREFTETERAVARGIAMGLTDAEIARALGVTRQRVGQVRRGRFS